MERLYGFVRCADGRWLALNRTYKPFGVQFPRGQWADYETCPGVRLWLTDRQIRRLDGGGQPYQPGDHLFWLYFDGTSPDRGGANLAAYRRRVAELSL